VACTPQITGGKDHSVATLSGIKVQDKTTDLCSDLASTDIPCPVAPGDVTSITSTTIGSIPSGRQLSRPRGRVVRTSGLS
jgi:hypothetical protein